MVLVDILCQTLQRDSCVALCQRSQELWSSKVRWRVPNPPADTSVCELEKAKRRSHPDREPAEEEGAGVRWRPLLGAGCHFQEVYSLRSHDGQPRWYGGGSARLCQNCRSNVYPRPNQKNYWVLPIRMKSCAQSAGRVKACRSTYFLCFAAFW